MNQGGIVDRYIEGKRDPIILLADLDGDNDLDLLNGSRGEDDEYQSNATGSLTGHKYDAEEKRMIRIDRERKTAGSLSNYNMNFISDIEVGLVNDDEYPDVIINRYDPNGENALFIHFGKAPIDGGGDNLNEEVLIYDQYRIADGLFDGDVKLADINNDGKLEIIQIGLTNDNVTSGKPKLKIYSYINSNSFDEKDISDQIASLSNSSFDLGDYDNDQDIDVIISGFDNTNGLQTAIYKNVTESGSNEFKFEETEDVLGASRDGSINFFDMENDGDLDVIITGTSFNGDVFEIYENKVDEDIKDWPKIETNIPGIRLSKVEFGDFNGDGFSDLLYSGVQSGFGKISN